MQPWAPSGLAAATFIALTTATGRGSGVGQLSRTQRRQEGTLVSGWGQGRQNHLHSSGSSGVAIACTSVAVGQERFVQQGESPA